MDRMRDLRGVVSETITEVIGDGESVAARGLVVSNESAVASKVAGRTIRTTKSAVKSASLEAAIVNVDVHDAMKLEKSRRRGGWEER